MGNLNILMEKKLTQTKNCQCSHFVSFKMHWEGSNLSVENALPQ